MITLSKGKTSDKVDLETDWDAYMETVQGITNMETFFEYECLSLPRTVTLALHDTDM